MRPRVMPLKIGANHQTRRRKDEARAGNIDPLRRRCNAGVGRRGHRLQFEPRHAEDARLVPISLASRAEKDGESEISLNCGAADLERFDPVHKLETLRAEERRNEDPKWDVGVEEIVVAPNYAPTAFGDYAGSL